MKNNPALANPGAEMLGMQVASYLFASGAPLQLHPAIDVAITQISMAGERGGYEHMVEFISVASTTENSNFAIGLLDRSIHARLKMIFVRGRKSFDVASAFATHLTPLW